MSNSVQISLGRRFPRFLFHVTSLLRQKSKLLVLNVNGLLCSLRYLQPFPQTYELWSPSKEEFQKYVCVVVRPGLKEFISLISPDFYVAIWSCMDDWTLGRLLDILFPPKVYKSFQFTWGRSTCTNTQAFISKNIPYLLKEYKTLQDACSAKSFSTKIKSYSLMTCPVSVFEISFFRVLSLLLEWP